MAEAEINPLSSIEKGPNTKSVLVTRTDMSAGLFDDKNPKKSNTRLPQYPNPDGGLDVTFYPMNMFNHKPIEYVDVKKDQLRTISPISFKNGICFNLNGQNSLRLNTTEARYRRNFGDDRMNGNFDFYLRLPKDDRPFVGANFQMQW